MAHAKMDDSGQEVDIGQEEKAPSNIINGGEDTNSEGTPELDIDLEARGEEQGYVLDVNVLKELTPKWQEYQLAPDGQTVLIPQPSTDRDDPLNWSWSRKHIILLVIAATSFLPDYGSATGAVTLIPQAKYTIHCSKSQHYTDSQSGNGT